VNLTHGFDYDYFPRIRLIAHSVDTGLTTDLDAIIDTGAEFTILDLDVASRLGLELNDAPVVRMSPVGGISFEANVAGIRASLLEVPELTVIVDVLFAGEIAPSPGNLIGLDILEHFDLALSHSARVGLIGLSV
jgi:predicted aspartyl protease